MKYENETLNARERTNGDYGRNAGASQGLKKMIKIWSGGEDHFSPMQRESLDLICTKIGRLCAGDPNCKDTWDDIAGYANLVSERLDGEEED